MKLGGGLIPIMLVPVLAVTSLAQVWSEVSFHLIDGWAIVAEGTLAGVPHSRMLIDTGAVPSVINLKLAGSLPHRGPAHQFSLLNRSVDVRNVLVPGVQIGPVAADALEMVAVDLGRIERALNTRIDAVIGLDLLSARNFSIDYRRRKLVFQGAAPRSESVLTSSPAAEAIAFQPMQEAGGTYILMPMECGGEKLQLLVDTGVKDLMLFRRSLSGGLAQLRVRGREPNLNPGGDDSLDEIEIQVKVGSLSRAKQKAYVWSASEQSPTAFDGMVGPTALGATVITFDFDRHTLSMETH